MRNLLKRTKCESCGYHYDSVLSECPNCHLKNPQYDTLNTENLIWMNPFSQIGLFLLLVLGASLISGIYIPLFSSLDKYVGNMWVNSLTYLTIFIILLLVIFPYRRSFISKLKNYKSYLWGLVFFFFLVGSSIALGTLAQTLFNIIHPGVDITDNANQSNLEILTKSFPLPALLIFGIIGPICEELGYRVGLFNFLKRFNNIIAYIASAIIFGFIHFNFLATGPALTYELLIIPNYIIAGILLAIIYDNFGLPASIVAHCANNILSLLLTLVVM